MSFQSIAWRTYFLVVPALLLQACTDQRTSNVAQLGAETPAQGTQAKRGKEKPVMHKSGGSSGRSESQGGKAVADLPSSFGKSFTRLDDYLLHLQKHAAPTGQAWYREVEPGVYVEETTVVPPPAKPQRFTREQLMRKFGFAQ